MTCHDKVSGRCRLHMLGAYTQVMEMPTIASLGRSCLGRDRWQGLTRRRTTSAVQIMTVLEARRRRVLSGRQLAMSWFSVPRCQRRQRYHGAETSNARPAARDWPIAATADHFQLCLRRPELILWACHDMLNPMPALEDAVHEPQGAMMPWRVER